MIFYGSITLFHRSLILKACFLLYSGPIYCHPIHIYIFLSLDFHVVFFLLFWRCHFCCSLSQQLLQVLKIERFSQIVLMIIIFFILMTIQSTYFPNKHCKMSCLAFVFKFTYILTSCFNRKSMFVARLLMQCSKITFLLTQ